LREDVIDVSRSQTIVIPKGTNCKIDAEVAGVTIKGPAVIVVLENTEALDSEVCTSAS